MYLSSRRRASRASVGILPHAVFAVNLLANSFASWDTGDRDQLSTPTTFYLYFAFNKHPFKQELIIVGTSIFCVDSRHGDIITEYRVIA